MGNHYTCSIGYADDITLLKSKKSGIKVLFEIYAKYMQKKIFCER